MDNIAKQIVKAEIMSKRYEQIYNRFTQPNERIANEYERLCTDSVFRITYILPTYSSLNYSELNHITIDKIYQSKMVNYRDSVKIFEVVVIEDSNHYRSPDYDIAKDIYILAIDYSGHFYPLSGFRKEESHNLYKSHFKTLSKKDNKLDFILLYLHCIEGLQSDRICTDENINELKRFYYDISKPKRLNSPIDSSFTLAIFAVESYEYSINIKCRYRTLQYVFEFSEKDFNVSKRIEFIQYYDKPCEE